MMIFSIVLMSFIIGRMILKRKIKELNQRIYYLYIQNGFAKKSSYIIGGN